MDEKKWVFVTGCAKGIGREILLRFLKEGYCAYAHARVLTPEWEQELKELEESFHTTIIPVCFDLTDSQAMNEKMTELISSKARIDVLVNNAGMMYSGLFALTEMETIRKVFDVNLFAVMELTQYVTKLMLKKKKGSIVNISSLGGIEPGKGMSAYGVSKAAIASWTQVLASEFGFYGIRVNAVAPGFTDTGMIQDGGLVQEKEALENRKGKLSRLADPQEIANAVYFLASEEAGFVNGTILRVDGGNRLSV